MFPCYAEGTLPLCHFGPLYTLALRCAFALSRAKSNYSRTSAPVARKSNHSRTYAKTGGWGGSETRFVYKSFGFCDRVN